MNYICDSLDRKFRLSGCEFSFWVLYWKTRSTSAKIITKCVGGGILLDRFVDWTDTLDFGSTGFAENIILGVDVTNWKHSEDKYNDFLGLRWEPFELRDKQEVALAKGKIYKALANSKFRLSFHYFYADSRLFINGQEIINSQLSKI